MNCECYSSHNYSQSEIYIPIENLTNIQRYDGYILRFPLFVVGSRLATVTFTSSKLWNDGQSYEFGKQYFWYTLKYETVHMIMFDCHRIR